VVGVFLVVAVLGMLGAGVVAVFIWKALTEELTETEAEVTKAQRQREPTKNLARDVDKSSTHDDRVDHARRDIKSLDLAISTFFTKHGHYPATLRELAEPQPDGSPPILADKTWTDPWGNAYIYDQHARQPMTERPLVYSNGPPGQNKRISNWD
jgi:hypothetical protein